MQRLLFIFLFFIATFSAFAQSLEQRMLVVVPDEYENQMDTFVRFKERQGMQVQLLPLSQAGTSASEIKLSIKHLYETNPFFYLLLIGDEHRFPVIHIGGYPADNDYAMMDKDAFPDVALGKLSINSSEELSAQLIKMMTFESGWQKPTYQYCNIAGNQNFDGETDGDFLRSLDSLWAQSGMNTRYELFDGTQGGLDAPGNPVADDLLTIVNRGVDVICYAGHGTAQTFSTTQFSVAHTSLLTNTSQWPILFSLACETGNYEVSTCLAESWMNASYQGMPAGAVAVLAAAAPIPWNAPKKVFRTMLEKLTDNPQNATLGAAWLAALHSLTSSDSCEAILHSWLIFGDPSMKLYPSLPNFISAPSQTKIAVFPNPADDYINISLFNDSPADLILVNTLGQTVKHYHVTSANTTLFLDSFPNGIYFLRGNHFTQKVVIRH